MHKKTFILAILLQAISLAGNSQTNNNSDITDADTLIKNSSAYNNKQVSTKGYIAHICGVDGKKMKLMTASGGIIKLVPKNPEDKFDWNFNNKKVRVVGILKESRIAMPYVEELKREKSILCHIDNTPCLDTAWVNKHKRTGYADTLSAKGITKLSKKIESSNKGYISVATIYVEQISILEEKAH